jgi:hypothetical protein
MLQTSDAQLHCYAIRLLSTTFQPGHLLHCTCHNPCLNHNMRNHMLVSCIQRVGSLPAAPGSIPGPSRLIRSHRISLLFPSFPRQAGSAPLPAAPTSKGGGAGSATAWGSGATAGTARDTGATGLAGPTPAADWLARRGSCPDNTRARGGRGGSGAGGGPWEMTGAKWAGDGARTAGLCGTAGMGGG